MNRDQLIQHIRKEIERLGSKNMQEEKNKEPKFILQIEEDLDKYLFYLGKTKEEKI